jgi:hypothetical protein
MLQGKIKVGDLWLRKTSPNPNSAWVFWKNFASQRLSYSLHLDNSRPCHAIILVMTFLYTKINVHVIDRFGKRMEVRSCTSLVVETHTIWFGL